MSRTDTVLAGCAVIVAGVLITAAANRSAEAYSMALQSQCAATVTAAAVIELAGADCASAQAAGHAPAVIELCRLTHGRSAAQVADLPQCREDAPSASATGPSAPASGNTALQFTVDAWPERA